VRSILIGMTASIDDVPSPCIGVCFIEPDSGLCRGCQRTLNEIANWLEMSADEKRATLRELSLRRAEQGQT
jgi:predicted Fe-S protein YdhL (DUF1289 family)